MSPPTRQCMHVLPPHPPRAPAPTSTLPAPARACLTRPPALPCCPLPHTTPLHTTEHRWWDNNTRRRCHSRGARHNTLGAADDASWQAVDAWQRWRSLCGAPRGTWISPAAKRTAWELLHSTPAPECKWWRGGAGNPGGASGAGWPCWRGALATGQCLHHQQRLWCSSSGRLGAAGAAGCSKTACIGLTWG